jgi:hypothetical protein
MTDNTILGIICIQLSLITVLVATILWQLGRK